MKTETETTLLPSTTASTEVSVSIACPSHEAPKRRLADMDPADWDSNIAQGLCLVLLDASASPTACPPAKAPKRHVDRDASNRGPGGIDKFASRSLDHFPSPSFIFPMPALDFDFRIAVSLNPETSCVEHRVRKEITTMAAGCWSGSLGNGRAVAGGYDLSQARGFRPVRIVEGAFVMRTADDPSALLEMRTRGSLSGPSSTLDTLLSPCQPKDIDLRQYDFRMFATVKSSDKRYADTFNCGFWVASGVWQVEELIIEQVIRPLPGATASRRGQGRRMLTDDLSKARTA